VKENTNYRCWNCGQPRDFESKTLTCESEECVQLALRNSREIREKYTAKARTKKKTRVKKDKLAIPAVRNSKFDWVRNEDELPRHWKFMDRLRLIELQPCKMPNELWRLTGNEYDMLRSLQAVRQRWLKVDTPARTTFYEITTRMPYQKRLDELNQSLWGHSYGYQCMIRRRFMDKEAKRAKEERKAWERDYGL